MRVLQETPAPDLARGRARVLARARRAQRVHFPTPRRASFLLAIGVSLTVFMFLAVVNSALGRVEETTVALTRTDTLQIYTAAPVIAPGVAATGIIREPTILSSAETPLPGIVPEPPRSAVSRPTPVLSPQSVN
jgi:hypothetical protein